jgi:serine/threonine protein kinase
LPLQQALWISRQAAQGLADLERAGFAHGDLKPDNIIVGHDGQVKLIDLAFARPLAPGESGARDALIAGTPEYLAPETLQRGAGTPLSKDLYSLGVTMYRMLTGRLPFQGDTSADVLRQQREAVPPPLRNFAPGVPRELAELVENLLSKQPLRRPHSATGLIDRLVMLELALLPSAFQG